LDSVYKSMDNEEKTHIEEHWEPKQKDRTAEKYGEIEKQQSKLRNSLQVQTQLPREGEVKASTQSKPSNLWNRLADLAMDKKPYFSQTLTQCGDLTGQWLPSMTGQYQIR
jgi:hypothetical protein